MDNERTEKNIPRPAENTAHEWRMPDLPMRQPSQPPAPTRPAIQPRPKKRRLGPLGVALTAFLVLAVLGCGLLTTGYIYYKANIEPTLQNFTRPVSRGKNEPTPTQGSYDSIAGRSWNVLLLGSDDDSKFSFPAILTQVMMVVHIDTFNNRVSMVSIPRDSWVSLPEVGGMHKIDQAFLLGSERAGNFEGGVRLARETIENDYGIPIDRYAWVGLDGFARIIDTLGGVDIDITHPIVDDTYPNDASSGSNPNDPYAYRRLYLSPGPQHLNGEQALEYVRSRHSDLQGDIGRTERQQQVLQALKSKINTSSVLNNLTQLLKDMQGKLYTDLNEQEMLAFANYANTLNGKSFTSITLGPGKDSNDFGDLSTVYDPGAGADQSVLIPNCANIQPLLTRVFELPWYAAGCNVTG